MSDTAKTSLEVLDELIRAYLDTDEPDPHVIAEKVAADLDDGDLVAVAAVLISDRVRAAIRHHRRDGGGLAVNGRRGVGALTRERMRWSLSDDEWLMMDDMTADQFDELAESYYGRAAANVAQGKACQEIAATMRRLGVARYGDLPDADDAEGTS